MRTEILLVALLAGSVVFGGCKHHNASGYDGGTIGDGGTVIHIGDGGNGGLTAACVSSAAAVQALGADVLFLLDTSYSMDYNLKWTSISQALEQFVQDPRFTGLGAGIQYFPLRETCDEPSYAMPAVPVDVLPAASSTLITSIESKRMAGGTPTAPAMQGVLAYETARAAANPTRKQVVVMATDGVPDDSCTVEGDMGTPNTIDEVVSLVTAAQQASPNVVTFVIGVGSELTALNAIAAAGGGTPTALLVDTTQDITTEFSSALDQIRKLAFACEFAVPLPPAGLLIDPTHVNVTFTTSSTVNFVYVGSLAGCSANLDNGWYYDDPKKPTKVILCDGACNAVRGSSNGEVDVIYGCETLIQ